MQYNIMENKKILIIDDDKSLCQSLEIGLRRSGAEVLTASNGKSGLQKFYEQHPDVVVLDIRMPEMDGWETCRMIRLVSDTPIIMLTSVSQEHEIVRGLRKGADDYVTKPFSNAILSARIEALLRRTGGQTASAEDDIYEDGYLHMDLANRVVMKKDERVKLSSTEFRLLEYLFENAGRTLSYESILTNVWGWECQQSVEYVHVYTSRLRTKLERDPRQSEYIVTEHGFGYGFFKRSKT